MSEYDAWLLLEALGEVCIVDGQKFNLNLCLGDSRI